MIFILLILNRFLISTIKTSERISSEQLLDTEKVSSQKLFNKTWKIIKNSFYDVELNHQNWNYWKIHYANKIETDEDAYVAINTMLASLDDTYSKYMSKDEYAQQNTAIDSKITGIGVNISSIAGKIYIVNVIEGTPASFAKIMPNDIILKIDDKEVKGMQISDVANLVKGPENSIVELTLLRNKNKLIKKLKRKEIKIKTVKASIDKEIGYIQILSFIGNSTPIEFVEALEKTQQTKGLIIDLRGNTGGLLPNATFIADMFIEKGPIVSIVGRNKDKTSIYASKKSFLIEKPTVLLVDGASASASEILAGALKDYNKAVLIGTKTFGKGMVQKIVPLPNETGLNLTIAKYLTPSGTDINKKGIAPDYEVILKQENLPKKNDEQFNKAKNVLNLILAKN